MEITAGWRLLEVIHESKLNSRGVVEGSDPWSLPKMKDDLFTMFGEVFSKRFIPRIVGKICQTPMDIGGYTSIFPNDFPFDQRLRTWALQELSMPGRARRSRGRPVLDRFWLVISWLVVWLPSILFSH